MTIRPWPPAGPDRTTDYRVFRVRERLARSPRTGEVRPYCVIEPRDWVNVVATTPDDAIILVRQWRHGTERETLEIPGGVVDPGETPAEAAARELREETGYAGDPPVEIGCVDANPAILSNRCWTYRIGGCVRVAEPDLDAGEDIVVETMPIADIDAAVDDGRITHALVVCALWWWRRDGKGGAPSTRS